MTNPTLTPCLNGSVWVFSNVNNLATLCTRIDSISDLYTVHVHAAPGVAMVNLILFITNCRELFTYAVQISIHIEIQF